MNQKSRLLLIEPFTALPQTSGGKTRIFHTITELNKKYHLVLWSFFSSKEEGDTERAWLKKNKINFKHFPTRNKDFWSYCKWGLPYWFSDWWNLTLITSVKSTATKFNIIQVEFSQLLYLVKYLPKKSKKVFVAYDIASVSFWRQLKAEKNILKKILYFWRFLEVYTYEWRFLPQYNQVVAVSGYDARLLKAHFRLKNVIVTPNGIEKVRLLPPRKADGYINLGYIGSLNHAPNKEAILFLLHQLSPELEKKAIKYRLWLAGSDSKEELNHILVKTTLKDKSVIKILGFVDNLSEFYRNIDILVAPIFAGSGSRVKILECLSYGRPVITTKIGAEGIDMGNEPVIKILLNNERSVKNWVEEILSIHKNYLNILQFPKHKLSKLTWGYIFKFNT